MKSIKFDPSAWAQAKAGASLPCDENVHVRLATPGTLEIDIGGGYRLVGYGDEFKVTLSRPGRVRSPNADFTLYVGYDVSVAVIEAPFTNFDKRPGDSSAERMVKRAFKEKAVNDALARIERKRADYAAQQTRIANGVNEDPDLADPDVEETPNPLPNVDSTPAAAVDPGPPAPPAGG